MKITAGLVKELRERTGAGMMDCKKALVEKNGNIEDAITYLREKGISKAAKKAGRVAAEGLVFDDMTDDRKVGVILEFNSETDFVAKNEAFIQYGKDITNLILNHEISTIDELNEIDFNGKTVKESTLDLIAKIGENMNIRRFVRISTDGFVNTYIHMGGSIGVITEFDGEATEENIEKAKDVTMHIAAMDPLFLSPEEVTEEHLQKEREIARAQLLEEGKPEKIIDKILIGKMNKYYEENCLIKQKFVKDDKISVEKYLGDLKIKSYVRYKIGEGIEKIKEDFAAEVAAQINK